MTIRGGAVTGNKLVQDIAESKITAVQKRELLVPTRGKLLAVYDPDTIKEDPPPESILTRIKDDSDRRLYAKVLIEGYEDYGPLIIPFRIPPRDILGDMNGMLAVQAAEDEFDLQVIVPAKNPKNAYITGKIAKSVKTVRNGLETPMESKPISLMSSSRVFSIIGV